MSTMPVRAMSNDSSNWRSRALVVVLVLLPPLAAFEAKVPTAGFVGVRDAADAVEEELIRIFAGAAFSSFLSSSTHLPLRSTGSRFGRSSSSSPE